LVAWLDAARLSVTEAARIQPGYCMAPGQAFCRLAPVTEGATAAAVIEATILEPPLVRDIYRAKVAPARLDVIHGTSLYAVGETVDVWPSAVSVTTGDRVLLVVEAGEPRTVNPAILVRLEHDDVADATCNTIYMDLGPVEVGRLTKQEILALRDGTTRAACYDGLLARDPCYADCLTTREALPDRCNYGATVADAGVDGSADAGVDGSADAGVDGSADAGAGALDDVPRAGDRPEADTSARASRDRPIETAPAGAAPGLAAPFSNAGGSSCAAAGGGSSAASVAVLLAVAGALVVRHRSGPRSRT
jgi:hypothetical protein